MEKVKEFDESGKEIRVPHIVDMHLNAAFVEKSDKMVVAIELMRCMITDVQRISRDNVTDLDSFQRSLLFAQLAELRKETMSILNSVNDLSTKTKVWAEQRCVQMSQPAKKYGEKWKQ